MNFVVVLLQIIFLGTMVLRVVVDYMNEYLLLLLL